MITGDDAGDDMGDGTRWLTYRNMDAAPGITTDSAKRLAMRHRWPRRPGNDGGRWLPYERSGSRKR